MRAHFVYCVYRMMWELGVQSLHWMRLLLSGLIILMSNRRS